MLERAQVRFWAPVIASAGFFPVLAFLMLGKWYLGLYFAAPTELATVPNVAPVRAPVEVAVAAVPPAALAEPLLAPPSAQTPEPSTTMSLEGDARPANFYPAQAAAPGKSDAMSSEPVALEPAMAMPVSNPPVGPQTEAPAPPTEQHLPETMTEASAPPTDEKAPEFTSALPMFATFAVAPPTQFTVEKPIPLPRSKPKAARVSRTEPLQPPQPIDNTPRLPSLY
jgi:hypothetical protein